MTATTATTQTDAVRLVLNCSANGGWSWFEVKFCGPTADQMAADYIARKGSVLVIEAESDPDNEYTPLPVRGGHADDWDDFPLTADALWPTCHHGMAARACMDPEGPNHFGTLAQEMAWEVG